VIIRKEIHPGFSLSVELSFSVEHIPNGSNSTHISDLIAEKANQEGVFLFVF
jgi:hypothetical protein